MPRVLRCGRFGACKLKKEVFVSEDFLQIGICAAGLWAPPEAAGHKFLQKHKKHVDWMVSTLDGTLLPAIRTCQTPSNTVSCPRSVDSTQLYLSTPVLPQQATSLKSALLDSEGPDLLAFKARIV